MTMTRKRALALTDAELSTLSVKELMKAVKYQAEARLTELAQTDPAALDRILAQVRI